ncbi:MAG: HD family hydrolase [Acidilobaceae archaeon]|nr:HD family hydrolase [Acidilobaceae archaeon]
MPNRLKRVAEGVLVRLEEVLRALSSLARTGWMLRGVPHALAESVAEHLFASALIAYELALLARGAGVPVEPERAMAIALVHDLAEAVVGDISKRAGLEEEKERVERAAYESLELSERVKELYKEYVKANSLEGAIAKIGDNLATYFVARRYIKLGYEVEDIAEGSIQKAKEIAERAGLGGVLERFLRSSSL